MWYINAGVLGLVGWRNVLLIGKMSVKAWLRYLSLLLTSATPVERSRIDMPIRDLEGRIFIARRLK